MNLDTNTLLEEFIEVELNEPDDFLKVKETLSRIGVASRKERKLYQSCHILHKQGRYYIVHFKELFSLDGKPSNFSDHDRSRRNTIAKLLDEWELVRVMDRNMLIELCPMNQIKIISHKEKNEWELIVKYNIGKK